MKRLYSFVIFEKAVRASFLRENFTKPSIISENYVYLQPHFVRAWSVTDSK